MRSVEQAQLDQLVLADLVGEGDAVGVLPGGPAGSEAGAALVTGRFRARLAPPANRLLSARAGELWQCLRRGSASCCQSAAATRRIVADAVAPLFDTRSGNTRAGLACSPAAVGSVVDRTRPPAGSAARRPRFAVGQGRSPRGSSARQFGQSPVQPFARFDVNSAVWRFLAWRQLGGLAVRSARRRLSIRRRRPARTTASTGSAHQKECTHRIRPPHNDEDSHADHL